jgi:hypothetical protein
MRLFQGEATVLCFIGLLGGGRSGVYSSIFPGNRLTTIKPFQTNAHRATTGILKLFDIVYANDPSKKQLGQGKGLQCCQCSPFILRNCLNTESGAHSGTPLRTW